MRHRILASLAASTVCLALACSAKNAAPTAPDITTLSSSQSRDLHPDVPFADAAELHAGNATFATEFTKAVVSKDAAANTFLSPYSISLALAMAYAGARGDTATEMASALDFTLPQERLHPAFNQLDLDLMSRAQDETARNGQDGKGFRLKVANSLWGDASLTFAPSFLDTLAINYGAAVRTTDFRGDAEGSRGKINGWVSDNTESRIQNILGPGTVRPETRLVLVNAIYFNAAWATPFAPAPAATFTKRDGTTTSASFIALGAELSYAESDLAQAVEIPYEGGLTSMVVIAPRAGQLPAFDTAFNAAAYTSIVGSMRSARVSLTVPKFKIAGEAFSVRSLLDARGMKSAFDGGKADFSGMSAEHLAISDVLHKAYIAVDEHGTEAAAATAVTMDGGAIAVPVDPPKEMRVDRPFYFFIRDVPTSTILFAGRLVDPSL